MQSQLEPFGDVYNGFLCGDEERIGRGLVGSAFALWGANEFLSRFGKGEMVEEQFNSTEDGGGAGGSRDFRGRVKKVIDRMQQLRDVAGFPENLQRLLIDHPNWEFVDKLSGSPSVQLTPHIHEVAFGGFEHILPAGKIPGLAFDRWEGAGIVPRNANVDLYTQIDIAMDSSYGINFAVDGIFPDDPAYIANEYPKYQLSIVSDELDKIFLNDPSGGLRASKTELYRNGQKLKPGEQLQFADAWRKLRRAGGFPLNP